MSRFHIFRSALGMSFGLAAASVLLPAFAGTPVTVTFPANSVWAQEIGNLTHSDNSLDYTVAVAAGKTLRLNLLTRNPNVYFRVTDQSHGKLMLDTLKTGEPTWSATNAAAITYAVRVYIDPGAIQSGETAKYALQIGQYGAADMRAPTTAVTFEAGKPWSEQDGTLTSDAAAHSFSVAIAAGMTVKVNLISSNPQLHFNVHDQTHGKKLIDTSTTGATTWSETVAAATTYVIEVSVDPSAIPPGQKAAFALQIGQYASGGTQNAKPASATTIAPPAAATST
ncbi:MAG TPA: hypothetical protein VGN24_09815 [Rhodanobacter sp.]|jgi:hypothetical protein|nr:hypothetical protein [Rhodanobacter sp.]